MSMGNTIKKEVMAWTGVGIIVVIASIILLKFKTSNPANITCASGYTFNATANLCYETANASNTAAVGSVASSIDTFVTAFSEPKNWITIVIIAIIGFGILKWYQSRNKS